MPLGAFKLNSIARYVAAAVAEEQGSWSYWISSNADTLIGPTYFHLDDNTGTRAAELIPLASDDYFYLAIADVANPYYLDQVHTYTYDGSGDMSYSSYSNVTTDITMNFTQAQSLTLTDYDKTLIFQGPGNYLRGVIGASSITWDANKKTESDIGDINASRYCVFHMPGDQTKIYFWDEDGDIAYYLWDDSTNSYSWQNDVGNQGNKASNVSRTLVFATDTSGTKGIALLYYDTVYGGWKVRHYSSDLTTYNDFSLGTETAPIGTAEKYGNMIQDINRGLFVAIKTVSPGDAIAFVVDWNGSTFTKNATLTIDNPVSATYPNGYNTGAVQYLGDDVYAVLIGFANASNYRAMNCHMLKVNNDKSVTELGVVIGSAPTSTASSPNAKNGISLTRDGSAFAFYMENETTDYVIRLVWKPKRQGFIITTNGNAQIDTAQSKFGGSSALFDGTGDYIASDSIVWHGASTGTIEMFFRLNSTVPFAQGIFSQATESTANGFQILLVQNKLYWYKNGSGALVYNTALSANTWYHLAVVKESSTTVKVYLDGTLRYTNTSQSGLTDSTNDIWFGRGYGVASGLFDATRYDFDGWIDEVRISSTARYTTNFTPSTTAFQNDANTLLLLHMDGTDGSTVFTDDNGA